jgi:hypothetical protein
MGRKKQKLARRQTVVSKKGDEYLYRMSDLGDRIRVKSGYGAQSGSLVKLAFANGRLTKTGEEYMKQLVEEHNKMFPDSDSQWTMEDNGLLDYVKRRKDQGNFTTFASWESHMIGQSLGGQYMSEAERSNSAVKFKRFLYNLNMSEAEIEKEILKAGGQEALDAWKAAVAEDLAGNNARARMAFLNTHATFDYIHRWAWTF